MLLTIESAGVLRLKRRREFLRVAGSGRKWVAPGLILQARRRGAGDETTAPAAGFRVGYTVSRKVGGAVERNRARRRLRAVAGRVLPGHARGGHDFVLIGRRATLTRPFRALRADLETALRKLDAYDD
ncbi:MAG: ribonuclease P protein component [Rhodospirillales bacterium]